MSNKYTIWVEGSIGGCYEVEADSWWEAHKKAKAKFKDDHPNLEFEEVQSDDISQYCEYCNDRGCDYCSDYSAPEL